jgi:hypothetical protein
VRTDEQDDDDNWPIEGDARVTECGSCGEVRPCRWLVDPFIDEVYPEEPNEPYEWCWSCYKARADDV